MLTEKIIDIELRGLGPPVVHVLLQLVIFMTKQKFQGISSGALFYYLRRKYCRRRCTLLPITGAESLAKFNPKMQNVKNCK